VPPGTTRRRTADTGGRRRIDISIVTVCVFCQKIGRPRFEDLESTVRRALTDHRIRHRDRFAMDTVDSAFPPDSKETPEHDPKLSFVDISGMATDC
jgi:hypothetical protein